MRFEIPKIEIKKFISENIITTSGISSAAQELADEMKSTATSGVNIVDWSIYSE